MLVISLSLARMTTVGLRVEVHPLQHSLIISQSLVFALLSVTCARENTFLATRLSLIPSLRADAHDARANCSFPFAMRALLWLILAYLVNGIEHQLSSTIASVTVPHPSCCSLSGELLLCEGSRRAHVSAHHFEGHGLLCEGVSNGRIGLLDYGAQGAALEHL